MAPEPITFVVTSPDRIFGGVPVTGEGGTQYGSVSE